MSEITSELRKILLRRFPTLLDTHLPEEVEQIGYHCNRPFLSFVNSKRFAVEASKEEKLTLVLISSDIASQNLISKPCIEVLDPKREYFEIYNQLAEFHIKNTKKSLISDEASIHRTAYISDRGVKIGKNVSIEAGVVIQDRVEIGEGSIIRAGAILGSPGFEHKICGSDVVTVLHDGIVKIHNRVEIGPGSIVGQGFRRRPTVIQSQVKIDNLVSIAHGSSIGERSLIAAGTIISGSVTIGKNVWIGPKSVIINKVKIGDNVRIALGSVVLQDAIDQSKWFGNPAQSYVGRLKLGDNVGE